MSQEDQPGTHCKSQREISRDLNVSRTSVRPMTKERIRAYTIWDSLAEKVYKGRTQKFTENELKEKIRKWEEITLEEVRKSIGSFKKRLRAVCEQNGGHIDHLLN